MTKDQYDDPFLKLARVTSRCDRETEFRRKVKFVEDGFSSVEKVKSISIEHVERHRENSVEDFSETRLYAKP